MHYVRVSFRGLRLVFNEWRDERRITVCNFVREHARHSANSQGPQTAFALGGDGGADKGKTYNGVASRMLRMRTAISQPVLVRPFPSLATATSMKQQRANITWSFLVSSRGYSPVMSCASTTPKLNTSICLERARILIQGTSVFER